MKRYDAALDFALIFWRSLSISAVTALNLLVVAAAALPIRYDLDEVRGENFGGHGCSRFHRIILKSGRFWVEFAYDASSYLAVY